MQNFCVFNFFVNLNNCTNKHQYFHVSQIVFIDNLMIFHLSFSDCYHQSRQFFFYSEIIVGLWVFVLYILHTRAACVHLCLIVETLITTIHSYP